MGQLQKDISTATVLRRVEEDVRDTHNYQTYYEAEIYNEKNKWKIKSQMMTFKINGEEDVYDLKRISINPKNGFNSYDKAVEWFDKEVNKAISSANEEELSKETKPSFEIGAADEKKQFRKFQKENQKTIEESSISMIRKIKNKTSGDEWTFNFDVKKTSENKYIAEYAEIQIYKTIEKNQEIRKECDFIDLKELEKREFEFDEAKKIFDKNFQSTFLNWEKQFEQKQVQIKKQKQEHKRWFKRSM